MCRSDYLIKTENALQQVQFDSTVNQFSFSMFNTLFSFEEFPHALEDFSFLLKRNSLNSEESFLGENYPLK